jgi:hypothetical protein
MPFDFLRRKPPPPNPDEAAVPAPAPSGGGVPFEALTEEWRLRGQLHAEGRLSDALNRRAETPISDVSWAPIDGSAPFSPVPGLKSVDPYDLILVFASVDSVPPMTADEKAAHKVHKMPYDVSIEAPPFRIVGTVYLRPGTEPAQLMDRSTEMFVPVVGGEVILGGAVISTDTPIDSVLVNRFYVRAIEQIDLRTGERPMKLPGQPLGGTTWRERTR